MVFIYTEFSICICTYFVPLDSGFLHQCLPRELMAWTGIVVEIPGTVADIGPASLNSQTTEKKIGIIFEITN